MTRKSYNLVALERFEETENKDIHVNIILCYNLDTILRRIIR